MRIAPLLALACAGAPTGGGADSACAPDTGCAEALTELGYDEAGPLGFSAQELLEAVGGPRSERLIWEGGGALSGVDLSLAAAWSGGAIHHRGCAGCGASGALLVSAELSVETADGGLSERLAVTLEAPLVDLASAEVSGAPEELAGGYAPAGCPGCASVGWTLDATLRPASSSGVFGFAGATDEGRVDLGTATWGAR